MSPSETFPFSVEVRSTSAGSAPRDAQITVLDGHDEERGTARGTLQLDLPPGLYTVQVERAGVRTEEVHRHSGVTDLVVDEPKRSSAVPTTDAATSHEYYEANARLWSNTETAPPLPAAAAPMGSLFLFLRAPSAQATTQPPSVTGLRLLDYAGADLMMLDAATTKRDPDAGWLAFHAAAPAGEYVLRYESPDEASWPSREMAIGVFPGWQTQIFMTQATSPLFGSASVLMGHGFRPDDRIAQAVDAALTGLQNGADLLLPDERQMLLYAKFDNPMLGLVGAHALFRDPTLQHGTIETIIENLHGLLGLNAPDVRALEVMAARRFDTPVDRPPFARPPLLRAGLEAVLEAAAENPTLVPSGGLLAQIAVHRFLDSPWSTWRPLVGVAPVAPGVVPDPASDWVSHYVQDAALEAARKDQDLDVATVAARASLPLESVSDAYEQVRTRLGPGPARTIEMERVIARARDEAQKLDLDQEETRDLFFEGGEGERIRALGLMQGGDKSIRDFDVALEGVRDSKSAFEQYHALRLAQQMIPELNAHQRHELASAIEEQRAPGAYIQPGSDRWSLSGQILRTYAPRCHRETPARRPGLGPRSTSVWRRRARMRFRGRRGARI